MTLQPFQPELNAPSSELLDEKTKEDLPKLVKHFYSSADALANAAMDRSII